MKKSIFTLLFISLFSCTQEEETPAGNDDNLPATTFINLTTNNFWKYRVETKTGTQPTVVAPNLDHLKVGEDEVVNGITFKKMEAVGTPVGYYTGTMDQKKLRKVSDRLLFNGNFTIELGLGVTPLSIPVENFIIFKESAANNVSLSKVSGNLNQVPVTLPINGSNASANLVVDYVYESMSGESYPTFTPPTPNSGTAATTYTNVKSVKIILNLKIMAQYGGVAFAVLNPQPQNIIVSTMYYAKNKGVVYTETNTNFSFANAPGSTTPLFPASSTLQREYLVDFLNN